MSRLSISLIALVAAFPAYADDFYTQAPVAAVTVYPQGADLTHRAVLDLPTGEQRVFLPYAGLSGLDALPRISTSEGVTIGALSFHPAMQIDREALFTEAQTAAWARVKDTEAAVTTKQDEIASASAEAQALKLRLEFLGKAEPGPDMSAEELLALADMLQTDTTATRTALVAAQAKLRPMKEALEVLSKAQEAAQADFDALSPPEEVADMISVELNVAEAGPVALELTELTDNAGWSMDYDLDLNRKAGKLAVSRKLIVEQRTGASWNDVALTLSTARPGETSSPSAVTPNQAWIEMPMEEPESFAMAPRMMSEAEPVLEPSPMMGDMKTASLQIDGLAISYLYPTPVTIAPGGGSELALDELALEATPLVLASPRSDDTAFTVARFTNTTPEPILPGWANILRDGHFVGREQIDLIPAGAKAELGFGPIEGIRLETIFDRNAEGDAGIINRSNTRVQTISFSVENLTGDSQDVRALFPLPFSEQEDLKVRINATPAPNETDIDHRRGVSAWDLALAPGEKRTVSIEVELDWPLDQVLRWYP